MAHELSAPVCATMPSASAARDFMAGVPGSFLHLLLSYLGRTAIVAAGMALAGKREHLFRDAAAGTAVIEATLLMYFSDPENRKTADLSTQQNIARFLHGNPQYIAPIIADIVLRAGQISLGMFAVGSKSIQATQVLAGSTAVEAFIALYSIVSGGPCPVPAMQLSVPHSKGNALA